MKQERLKALAKAKTSSDENESLTEHEMQLALPTPVTGHDYRLETFKYDMQKETDAFHALYRQWYVGSVDYVYYIPDFVTQEEEAELLSDVRQTRMSQKI